jgi:uncharacterized protein (TIGR04255 family)
MSNPLPDYNDPPVVETVLGVQFDRLPGFTNAHLGAFWKTLDTNVWCTVQDASPLAPQFERFDKGAQWAKGIQLQLTQDPTWRLQIKNQRGDRMIQLQNNRVHFNWLGESGGRYPRYDAVLEGFRSVLKDFVAFIEHERMGQFRPNQWEVTYVNHMPQGTVWNTPKDWSFFLPLSKMIVGDLQEESFGGEWHFVIPEERGRLHVQWNHGLKSASDGPDREEIVRLMLTARGPLEVNEDVENSIVDGLNLGRMTIVSSFRDLMSDTANQYWGLKNATNDK